MFAGNTVIGADRGLPQILAFLAFGETLGMAQLANGVLVLSAVVALHAPRPLIS